MPPRNERMPLPRASASSPVRALKASSRIAARLMCRFQRVRCPDGDAQAAASVLARAARRQESRGDLRGAGVAQRRDLLLRDLRETQARPARQLHVDERLFDAQADAADLDDAIALPRIEAGGFRIEHDLAHDSPFTSNPGAKRGPEHGRNPLVRAGP